MLAPALGLTFIPVTQPLANQRDNYGAIMVSLYRMYFSLFYAQEEFKYNLECRAIYKIT